VLIAIGVVVFLAVSVLLARFLTGASTERDAVYALLVDQVHGDQAAMLGRLEGCEADAGCKALVAANVRRLRQPGAPKILSFESKTAYALGRKTARARVAWAIVSRDGLPVVQCVTIDHRWSLIDGPSVSLRRLSAPIGNEAGC
jgi:hypothetical protein